jgi:hypothetical protein
MNFRNYDSAMYRYGVLAPTAGDLIVALVSSLTPPRQLLDPTIALSEETFGLLRQGELVSEAAMASRGGRASGSTSDGASNHASRRHSSSVTEDDRDADLRPMILQ